jgi:hypothetical protein
MRDKIKTEQDFTPVLKRIVNTLNQPTTNSDWLVLSNKTSFA